MLLDPNKDIHNELLDLRNLLANIPHGEDEPSHLHEIAAIITTAFDRLGLFLPVVVGGLAVETYTSGSYTTEDIDFIHPDPSAPARIMNALGFFANGKNFIHHILNVYVEFPEGDLEGERSRALEVLMDDDSRIIVIGIEDIILDRIAAYQNWDKCDPRSRDGVQAVTLLVAKYDVIDYDYLQKTALEKNYTKSLAELQARANIIIASKTYQ
jgi:hypothetical protein